MAKKSCKKGYYYCYASKKCKRIPMGYYVGGGGWLRKEDESDDGEGKKKNGNGNGSHSNGNGNGNGSSNGGSNGGGGGGVSEAWSAKYKKSIDCDNPKGFSQRAHCRGRKKVSEEAVSKKQQKFFGIVRAIQKGEVEPTTPETAKAARDMKKSDVKKFASTKHKGLPEKKEVKEDVIAEKRDGKSAKSKGYSLRDWFKGGGWVQAGGKYDGKPCAKQPGQKTKPFCRDADDRANMSKKERSRRAAKKRREDPNPNRKGKAKMVSASYSNWRNELQLNEGMGLGLAAGAAALAIPYLAKKYLKPKADKALQRGRNELHLKGNPIGAGARGLDKQSYEPEGDTVFEGDYRYGSYSTGKVKMLDGSLKTPADIDAHIKSKKSGKKPPVQTDKAHYEPEGDLVDEGKKDACYHKVKSRYSVWPSAYASGALVKCRKVGAKNWGNKTKKEGYEFSNWRDDFQATEYESVDIIKAEPLQPSQGIGSDMLDEAGKKCWKGYKKAGTQKLFGKTYNRCVKAHFSDWRAEMDLQEAIPGYDKYNAAVKAAEGLKGRERIEALKAAAKLRPPTEKEVNQKLGEDWQKSNRKDGVDGMSQKSVDAYKRENPGSKLKTAVTGKVKKGSKDSKRRKSFCARSDGQRKMHNIDCKKTPDKKICKARRRWKC